MDFVACMTTPTSIRIWAYLEGIKDSVVGNRSSPVLRVDIFASDRRDTNANTTSRLPTMTPRPAEKDRNRHSEINQIIFQ
jgi:hypothetical protein